MDDSHNREKIARQELPNALVGVIGHSHIPWTGSYCLIQAVLLIDEGWRDAALGCYMWMMRRGVWGRHYQTVKNG